MIQLSNRALARTAAVVALVVALGLAGCGRKSGLDLPPAATASEPAAEAQSAAEARPALGPDGKPMAPATGPKKTFILDWLLN